MFITVQVLQKSLNWLDQWELQFISKQIAREHFLTASTASGLRVTLLSTIQLTEFLLDSCGFKYVLSGKFNQDVIEVRFTIELEY